MAHYNSGIFTPKFPEKYVGNYPINWRSSWELTVMNMFDSHPNVISWASESIEINYQDPFTGKWRRYYPDFFVMYMDKDNVKHGEVIEVKPLNQTLAEAAKSRKNRQEQILNTAKWKAAIAWCARQGLKFRIMTEAQIYRTPGK